MKDRPLLQLLQQCQKGDSSAQKKLFEGYKNRLFAVCLRYARDRAEAQDILQEAFVSIFRDLHQFSGEGAFDGWLHRVTVRAALQHLRKRNVLRFAVDYDDMPTDARSLTPDTDLNHEAILKMVQQLPDGYRAVFNLHCMEAFSYTEIAAELGISESSVRSQYSRACKQLRGLLEHLLIS
ncbi:MAG: RNA polymerase sigma factor [Saprospiraceae bacterium]|nr:RNA polymerase sigma factor [Saprospiraceae bacterium]